MTSFYFYLFKFIRDTYWCYIPYRCRECFCLTQCRYGFIKGRKCRNGCLKYKKLYKWKHKLEREDYLDNLVKYVEEQEKK